MIQPYALPATRGKNPTGDNLAGRFFKSTDDLVFHHMHGGQLIYNTSWEDPRIDRQLLQLDGSSRVVMITSAGCNVLDTRMPFSTIPPEIPRTQDENPLRMLFELTTPLSMAPLGCPVRPCTE